jgi:stearoyl-CoA desaturase (delta-9 desaturase)
MMKPVLRIDDEGASALLGRACFDFKKILWVSGLLGLAIGFGPSTFSIPALLVFLGLSYFTLLIGHSVGMHRMMIHRSFECPKPIERFLIYIGVLVGMGGPLSIIKVHDTRDWAQRKTNCHDYFSHRRGFLRDISWQLFYRFEFVNPPILYIESSLSKDKWILFFERTWWAHQILLAGALYFLGGLPLVIWGVCLRVPLSIIGHWTVTYICHNPGPGKWRVKDAGVQASNLRFAGFLTHGECWHNNHHAFPESARVGLDAGQTDPAWRVIQMLSYFGLAKNIGLPRSRMEQEGLILTKPLE